MPHRADGKLPFFTRIHPRTRARLRALARRLNCPQNEVIERALALYVSASRLAARRTLARSAR